MLWIAINKVQKLHSCFLFFFCCIRINYNSFGISVGFRHFYIAHIIRNHWRGNIKVFLVVQFRIFFSPIGKIPRSQNSHNRITIFKWIRSSSDLNHFFFSQIRSKSQYIGKSCFIGNKFTICDICIAVTSCIVKWEEIKPS